MIEAHEGQIQLYDCANDEYLVLDIVNAAKIYRDCATLANDMLYEVYRVKLEGDFGFLLTVIVCGVYDQKGVFVCSMEGEEDQRKYIFV
jgi:hypothetical protein